MVSESRRLWGHKSTFQAAYIYARQFRSVPSATAIFQVHTHQFLFLSSINFLTLLDYEEFSQQQGSILELSPEDSNRFRTMQKADKQLQAAFHGSETGTLMVKTRFISSSHGCYCSIKSIYHSYYFVKCIYVPISEIPCVILCCLRQF